MDAIRIVSSDEIKIVAASSPDGKKIEYWAVAAEPQIALIEILQRLPSGWMVGLTGENLTLQEAAVLDMYPSGVRKLQCRPSSPNVQGVA